MSAAQLVFHSSERGKEVDRARGENRIEWNKTPDGIAATQRTVAGFRAWRHTPEGDAWFEGVLAIKKTPEYSAKLSQSQREFYKTERGQELKEHYRNLYSGIPRPPEVTEKMKQSLDDFWNSLKGNALAEEISNRMTNGLPETPYGPNWKRQRQKAIKRDHSVCKFAHLGNCLEPDMIDVHHIFPNRFFGYIPGENEHFRWANHLNNLICLCRRCHRLCESTRSLVPEPYLSKATEHYGQYVLTITH